MKSKAAAKRKPAILVIVNLVILLAGCGGGSTSVGNQPPPPPPAIPTITTLSPNSILVNSVPFMLTITGTNFVAGSKVNFGGSGLATMFVSPTVLNVDISTAIIGSPGTLAVTVTNPAPGGGTSNAQNFTVTSTANAVPTISFISPSCAPAGSLDLFPGGLFVGGLSFVPGSVVRWNGINQPTTFKQSTVLTAEISASDIAAVGTAAVTVFNPDGTSSNSLNVTIMAGALDPQSIAVDPTGKFAYVASAGCADQGYVSMYTIDSATGALASIGPPVPQDTDTDFVVVAPSGKFVYVTSSGDGYVSDGSVAAYTINATTGALTFVGAISGNSPGFCCFNSAAVDPSGKFAYAANGGGGSTIISMYTINGTTGALASSGTIAAGGFPVSITVDPSGKFAYVANQDGTPGVDGNVAMFMIDANTGALTSIGTIAAGTNPVSITVDPTGKYTYVADSSSNDVWVYTINSTTGVLTSIGTIAAGTNPGSVAVDPASKFVYVTNFTSNDVSMYTINSATGSLTSVGTIAAGTSPTSIAIHPSGKFAYVTNSGSNDVLIYTIDANTGVLTLVGTIGT